MAIEIAIKGSVDYMDGELTISVAGNYPESKHETLVEYSKKTGFANIENTIKTCEELVNKVVNRLLEG